MALLFIRPEPHVAIRHGISLFYTRTTQTDGFMAKSQTIRSWGERNQEGARCDNYSPRCLFRILPSIDCATRSYISKANPQC